MADAEWRVFIYSRRIKIIKARPSRRRPNGLRRFFFRIPRRFLCFVFLCCCRCRVPLDVDDLGFTEFYRVSNRFLVDAKVFFYVTSQLQKGVGGRRRFGSVRAGFTGFYWVLLGFTGFYRVSSKSHWDPPRESILKYSKTELWIGCNRNRGRQRSGNLISALKVHPIELGQYFSSLRDSTNSNGHRRPRSAPQQRRGPPLVEPRAKLRFKGQDWGRDREKSRTIFVCFFFLDSVHSTKSINETDVATGHGGRRPKWK